MALVNISVNNKFVLAKILEDIYMFQFFNITTMIVNEDN